MTERKTIHGPGPETKGGGYHGGPKRWTGRGPAPARHVPWPEVMLLLALDVELLTRGLSDIQASYLGLRRSSENGRHGTKAHSRRYGKLEDDHGLCGTNPGNAARGETDIEIIRTRG